MPDIHMRVVRAVVPVSALIAWHAAMSASAVYQWEDEKGQVHFSDTVPDKYKRAARRQTNRGPLKAGAYEACGPEIANPEPRCGPEKRLRRTGVDGFRGPVRSRRRFA